MCAQKQYITMHNQLRRGQPKKEVAHNVLKATCEESSVNLLVCPKLLSLRKKQGIESLTEREIYNSKQLIRFLMDLFIIKGHDEPTLCSHEEKPTQEVKRGRSPKKMGIPSPHAQPFVVQTVSHMEERKRPRENVSPIQAKRDTVSMGKARTEPGVISTSSKDMQRRGNRRAASGARAE
ncbi:hypothetical protein TbgDal_II4390 [Trypanosoma brucei gambiense DAL972]|uniref:Uncharacterized protein n=2 Tax=Trypanosoma brucei TaxID=5691 RepID=C9ZJU9_TRYB9|nr:hypothetical protein TbgDal_II4390 [Trypanosoma brucei gambiense DAL972]RHW74152.1 hypothetical protein DPX39_020029300 [Trypanosoma brucei equiperdum]CBH09660.1 hypothetical protein TbgDal_II4390 [Trypanosoma brucei gambiense DAL972]|eukprot:XP_011771963.1 hypothetical protein TbgDal_II4390 [Trypanosoma brucei gambiense DAL972]